MLSPRTFLILFVAFLIGCCAVAFGAGYAVCLHADRSQIEAASAALVENMEIKRAMLLPEQTPGPLRETARVEF